MLTDETDREWSAFDPAQETTMELVRAANQERKCTFFLSSNYINPEAAKLGYLLHELLGFGDGTGGPYRSLFVTSGAEAMSGAIKVARHTSVRSGRQDAGQVLFLDPGGTFQKFFDPTDAGPAESLSPNMSFIGDQAEAAAALSMSSWSALVLVRCPGDEDAPLRELAAAAHVDGALVILGNSELPITDPAALRNTVGADIVVLGENLSARQVPIGSYTMSPDAAAVWNNDTDAVAQTATFGGNRMCTRIAVDLLDRLGHVTPQRRAVLDEAEHSWPAAVRLWGRYVNPVMAELSEMIGSTIDIESAAGSRIRTGDDREIIDCSGGFGSNLRGHNPTDVPATLDGHDSTHDYFEDLEELLGRLSGLPKAFPAVSGATAVDTAIAVSLLARPGRRKIVTFDGNFSGKTLFALNLSNRGPHLSESDPEPFRPYYSDVVYIDPFADRAADRLVGELRSGEVAVVWFELIQGGLCRPLPKDVLDVVARCKAEGGYLVGVDELLTGGWRATENYLAHHGELDCVDIVTVGKTLSDMTLPMAAVLATTQVVSEAEQLAPRHIRRLRHRYRNRLSAHLALAALTAVSDPAVLKEALRARERLHVGLERMAEASPLLGPLLGQGGLVRWQLNSRYFPSPERTPLGNLLELAMANLVYERCGVLVFLLRFLHRVMTDESDVEEILARLAEGLRGVKPWRLWRHAAGIALYRKNRRLGAMLTGGLDNARAGAR